MDRIFACVESNENIAERIFEMKLRGDFKKIKAPGPFVNILIPGCYLRRPISVCDFGGGTLTLVYKIVGDGTAALARAVPGDRLDVLTGLGNG